MTNNREKWQQHKCKGTAVTRDILEPKPLGPCLSMIHPSVPWILVGQTPEIHELPTAPQTWSHIGKVLIFFKASLIQ